CWQGLLIVLYDCCPSRPWVCHIWGFGGPRGPPQGYGMLLYQNYRIPQQRKAVLSPFSTPVVSKAAGPKTKFLLSCCVSVCCGHLVSDETDQGSCRTSLCVSEKPEYLTTLCLPEGGLGRPNSVTEESAGSRFLCHPHPVPTPPRRVASDGLYFPEVQTRFILSNYDLNDPSMSVPRCQTIPQKESLCFPELTYPRKDSADELTASRFQRSVSENSLVAMDFSGQTGRVIENPAEAQSAALEEGHAWRRNGSVLASGGGVVFVSLCCPSANAGISFAEAKHADEYPREPKPPPPFHPKYRTQHWFHGRISREESHRIIKQQGLVDGLFLLRDSQSNPKAFVLTLCHHQKIKNFQILPCEDDGQTFFSLDDGNTKFSDLIQLVDFYQLNKGVLPCRLKHHCIRVAL
ncbi:hypothetical protein E2I00_016929, partial [Balaenoptera physalus]